MSIFSRRRTDPDLAAAIALMSGRTTWSTEGIEHLGLEPVVMTDGPHGVRRTTADAAIIAADPSTCFPTAAGLATSWDPELIAEVGEAIGVEAKALGVSVVLGPGMNVKRHPHGGRNFEYFSEDPLLGGELAAGMVRGIQRAGVGACIKHLVANNQEHARMTIDAIVDERALHEIYLAGFERVVRTEQPWMVMCAYNRLNGTYCSDDRWLLTEVLRERWGFEGVVVTDWGAANDRVAGVRAGLDLEMPGSGGANDPLVVAALERGELLQRELDEVVERMSRFIARGNSALVGGGSPATPALGSAMVASHHDLARRAAAASCVLLTNDGILPVEPTGSIAVIGAFAAEPRIQGAGSSQVTPTRVDTLLDSLRVRVGDAGSVRYAAGYDPDEVGERDDLHDEAVLVARAAEVAVVVVGLPSIDESEGFDRTHLRLPDDQNRLVRSVAEVNPNTVVVVVNGAPVQLPWIDRPRAVVEAYLGGQGAGHGLTSVLVGDIEPSGRLAETFAVRAADHGADAWFPGANHRVEYRESIHVGYRWFDTVGAPVLFPFGHGLSYTSFSYGPLALDASATDADAEVLVTASVEITNTGARRGAEVVQWYARRPESGIARSQQELVAFRKVWLDPGASIVVEVELDRRSFAHWDTEVHDWRVEPGVVEIAAGSSSRDIHAVATCTLDGTWSASHDHRAVVVPAPTGAADLADDARFERLLGRRLGRPEPTEPFHRNSTLDEVGVTGLGRGLRAGAVKAAQRQLDTGDGLDAVTERLVERMMAEAPLRAMVLLGGGRLSWANLDRMIAAMNGARRLGRRRR